MSQPVEVSGRLARLKAAAVDVAARLARHAMPRAGSICAGLRHSGAVLAAATGAGLAELMARLGHSTPQAAMRYQHAAQGRDREIAALLSKMAATP